jgi:hypothetical protein
MEPRNIVKVRDPNERNQNHGGGAGRHDAGKIDTAAPVFVFIRYAVF